MNTSRKNLLTVILFALGAMTLAGLAHAGVIPVESLVFAAAFGTTYSEGIRPSDWLKWEEDQRFSRDAITVLSGQNLVSGTILGRTLVSATATAAAFAGNTGTGAMGAITVTGPAKRGVYKVIFIEPAADTGTFEVEDPDGVIIGRGTVAVAFSAGGLAFTIADATDFVSGDGFNITVVAGTYKYAGFDPAATNGAQVAAGILFEAVDASAADTAGVAITRNAIVGNSKITWANTATADQKAAALATLQAAGIVARTQV